MSEVYIHQTSQVSSQTKIGLGTKIWNWVQIREGVEIGKNVIVSKGVYIDSDVKIGNNVKIQNHVSVFKGVLIEDGVFIGPHVCFTNDLRPRAINKDGSQKSNHDWIVTETRISYGAALGANSTILCGITIGKWAMVGSGSVVTKNVPAYAIVVGNPARIMGYVCPCGEKAVKSDKNKFYCEKCKEYFESN